METYAFWREREARFLELTGFDRSAAFHACHVGATAPVALEQSSGQTEPAERWILNGGPSDPLAWATLYGRFQAEARIAAIGAGAATATSTDQAALEAWLDRLVAEESPHFRASGVLRHLAHASVDLCNQLASRAFRAEAGQAVNAPRPDTPKRPLRFPNRAAWLDQEVAAKNLTPNRIKVLGGLDPRTTARIRQGHRVGPQVLRKLAMALSIAPDKIPND